MQTTFDAYWHNTQWGTKWSNLVLDPLPHIQNISRKAATSQALSNFMAQNHDTPERFFPWILDPIETEKMISKVMNQTSAVEELIC